MIEQENLNTYTVIGGGAMGTALAHLLSQKGKIKLWVYEKELVHEINEKHENTMFLPGVLLSRIYATNSIEEALRDSRIVFSVTPAQQIRNIWKNAASFLPEKASIICASKGIETGTGKLLSEVYTELFGPEINSRLAFLSGPSFAQEIVEMQPTAVVLASQNSTLAEKIQHLVSSSTFRVYTTDDTTGVQMGGALKNVIAIAVGISKGMNLGINSRSALITRGLAEISRLAVFHGSNPLTLAGLAGMGDLVLTCTGELSRNLQVGIRLGKGEILSQIMASMKTVAEGVSTAHSTLALAKKMQVEMPITQIVVELLLEKTTPQEAVSSLMGRRLRSEKEI